MSEPVVRMLEVSKTFTLGNRQVNALQHVNLELPRGIVAAIVGPSGSGKTTMLNMMGGLDKPSKGQVFVDDQPIHSLSESGLVDVRRRKVGYVFQSYNLIPNLSATENVELPLEFARLNVRGPRVRECLRLAELPEDRWHHRPVQLSGGEQQRVAIARALANDPRLVLADEPTGNLDSKTSKQILKLFRQLVDGGERTVVIITHDREVAAQADLVIEMRDGEIQDVKRSAPLTLIAE